MFYSPFDNAVSGLNKIKNEIADEKLFFGEDLVCKRCKTRLSDLLETGYVGCEDCYSMFEKDVLPMIYDFHKAVRHTGKRPEIIETKAAKQKQIEELLKRQAEASASEDYILAQSIKEKIEELRRK